ncbi:MAG: type VI secretion system tube protein Hcp [Acidobacteriaceae bacterium]|jgi:type VI protein secretion system component Hcp
MLRIRSIGRLIFLGIAVALLPAPRATASTPATMTIESASSAASQGSKGGKANKQSKGAPEDQIELLSVSRPGSDAASGAASGGARKTSGAASGSSLIVTKAYDATSAQLEQAEATNEFLHQVTITFASSATGNGTGSSKGAVTGSSTKKSKTGQAASTDSSNQTTRTAEVLVLKNAQITSIEQTRNIQQITIEYQSIEVTYTSGKTAAATDDWETP